MQDHPLQIADLFLRVFTGVLFLFQGYDKLFRIKLKGVTDAFINDAEKRNIPRSLVSVLTFYTSLVEFFGGLFLIVGFMTTYTLYALGLDLILVGLAFSVMQPMWDMKHLFPRFVLVIALLVLPVTERCLALDKFLHFTF